MQKVYHNGKLVSFSRCVLRGDGWGCAVLSDGHCYQIRNNGGQWETTGKLESLSNFLPSK